MFELEKTLLKKDINFFKRLQAKDFYITDSGDTKIVLENAKNKCLMFLTVDDNKLYLNFKNSNNEFINQGWFLGNVNDLFILEDIFEILAEKSYLDFANVKIHEGSKNYTETQKKIKEICDEITELLIDKNQKYGNSALKPKNIFYKGNAENSILIRLDDKIGRIANNNGEIRTNDIVDIIGYLVLYLVYKNISKQDIEKLKD